MDAYRWEVAFDKQFIQFSRSANTFNKNDNLVKVQCVKKVVQFPVFLQVGQLDVMLPRQVKNIKQNSQFTENVN